MMGWITNMEYTDKFCLASGTVANIQMEGFVTLSLIILGLILMLRYLRCNQKKTTSDIPEIKGYPLIGCATKLDKNNLHGQFSNFAREYGKMFKFNFFGQKTLVLNSAESVIKAFSHDSINGRAEMYAAEKIVGQIGTSMRDRDSTRGKLRKYFTQSLHFYGEGIPAFEKIVKEEIHTVMDQIRSYNGEEFEVIPLARVSLINVIHILIYELFVESFYFLPKNDPNRLEKEMIMSAAKLTTLQLIGEHANEQGINSFDRGLKLVDFFFTPTINLLLTRMPFLRFAPFLKSKFNELEKRNYELMDILFYQMKETWEPGKLRGIVDWYLQEQRNEMEEGKEQLLSDEMIRAMITDFVTAGISTTATVLPNTILCLVHHPEYQQKIQEELDRVVGTDREPSVSDRKECHVLQAVVMESMRLLTPLPFLLPHVCSEDTIIEGNRIAKNTQVLANIWHIHHDENVWTDPWIFRPERFLDQDGKLLQSSDEIMKNWIPFGTGRRKCPGLSFALSRIFLYMSFLLQQWTFVPVPGKCGSYDPRKGEFDANILFKAKPFFCVAKDRF